MVWNRKSELDLYVYGLDFSTKLPRLIQWLRIVFSINDPGTMAIQWILDGYTYLRGKKKEVNPYLIPYIKIYLKCITDLNVNFKMVKLLREKLYFRCLGKDFLDHTNHETEKKQKR